MKPPTFPPNRVIREGRDPEDQTAFVQVRGDLESLWFAVLGLVVGGLLGFAAGWLSAADFIHG